LPYGNSNYKNLQSETHTQQTQIFKTRSNKAGYAAGMWGIQIYKIPRTHFHKTHVASTS